MGQLQVRRTKRKFGRSDFGLYEDIISDVSLGTKSLGKVTVDCQFQYKKSQWGVLTEEKYPAGIIYLNLNFHQPGGHRLKSASITVTLDDDSEELSSHFQVHDASHDAKLQIRNYGPTQIVGAPKEAHKTVEHNAAPELEAAGVVGFGNVGRRSQKDFDQEYRWTFLGQKRPAKNSSLYKVLTWTLTENELDEQSFHHPTMHTAFAFQHNRRPFFIQVAISGRMKSKLSGLGRMFSSLKDARFATTLVNFNSRERFTKVLDPLAESLPEAMEMENVQNVPAQVKGPQEPKYQMTPSWSPLEAHDIPSDENIKRTPLLGYDDKELKEDEETCLRALLRPSKPSDKRRAQTQQHSYNESPGAEAPILDGSAIDEQNLIQGNAVLTNAMDQQNGIQESTGLPNVVDEQRKVRNGSIQSPATLADYTEEQDKTKLGLSTYFKTHTVEWEQLVRYSLQVFGLVAILKALMNLMS